MIYSKTNLYFENYKGMDVVKKIEKTRTNDENRPLSDVVISNSGTINVDTPIKVERQ